MGTPPHDKGAQPTKPSPSSFTSVPANKGSQLLEKTRGGMRRSTPDSEALASSDDEVEQKRQNPSSTQALNPTQNQTQVAPVVQQTRRTSWLNDVPTTLSRKASLQANSSVSGSSNPTSPAVEQTTWGATSPKLATSLAWGASSSGSFPWGTGIWTADTRKDPPSRLSEVLQSPTSSNPPNSTSTAGEEILSPAARASISGESAIPFAIPLHPTPKTYRSQSYSVGQLDPETGTPTPNNTAFPAIRGRNSTQYPIQRRASRPSILGELRHDPASLGRVREDDDDGNANEPNNSYNNWTSNQARTIEQLTLENNLLRQAATSQLENHRLRDRALSSASAHSGYSVGQTRALHPIQGSVPEESSLAVEDLDELGDFPGYNNARFSARRRYSEHSANLEKQFPTFASLENRTLENLKRAQWQSTLGFGGISALAQSRRHSFADVPTRHPSLTSGDSQAPIGTAITTNARENGPGTHPENVLSPSTAENVGYFSGRDISLRTNETVPSTGISTSLHQAYVMPNAFGRQHALSQPSQQLFIVTFKCCRADVFYIQEDTGLQVKPGDLVIVEADRGTDLGTVAHANVSWAKAREYKEHYAEEHYKWLMLFSRQSQTGAANALNPNGVSILTGGNVGGMGPQSHHAIQDQVGEIKPKLIKRLAQNHEIQTLRDKEGNEAKAKRVCQQKVAEHRLNMEILDAEFQMDWKKLTFYYFADTYINFNALVTDLFKIYKTRIWMSAINPASFATPSAGLHPPGMYGQNQHADHRRALDYKSYGAGVNQGLSPSAFAEQPNRDGLLAQRGALRGSYLDPYQAFNVGGRTDGGYAQPQTDPFATYPSSNYGFLDPNAPEYGPVSGVGTGGLGRMGPTQNDWVNSFQGLSLGS